MSQIIAFEALRYPCFGGDHEAMVLLTILVKRVEGTVKAYAGIVPDDSREDPSYSKMKPYVQVHGAPLRYREAKAIWPDLKDKEYAT